VIKVLNPGLSTTIQDSGRMNGLAFGVPKGGAMDLNLAYFVNALVGNPISYPVIEFTLIGGEYEFSEMSTIALSGYNMISEINGIKTLGDTPIKVNKGDVLKIKSSGSGRYCYLAIQGKIKADEFWGSYSTYEYAKKGGYKGRRLIKGDEIEICLSNLYHQSLNKPQLENQVIRICKGPEFKDFSFDDIKRLVNHEYTIGLDSNRMGYRLEGSLLNGTKTGNILSSGVIPGTIQVPASGSPIVLMADSPCTGGYPRIAVVHHEDFRKISQALPNQKIKFVWDEF